MTITVDYTTCNVNDTPNPGRYVACLEVILPSIYLFVFIYLGFLRRFQHCTGHITMGSWEGRGNQYIQFVRVLYCKLTTNGKQLPAFPLDAVPETEPRPQRWEILPLNKTSNYGTYCHWCKWGITELLNILVIR